MHYGVLSGGVLLYLGTSVATATSVAAATNAHVITAFTIEELANKMGHERVPTTGASSTSSPKTVTVDTVAESALEVVEQLADNINAIADRAGKLIDYAAARLRDAGKKK